MVIGKTLPYFHSQLYFLGNGMKKLIIKQEALKPSFVDTGGGVLGKIQIWNKLICRWKDRQTDRQSLNRKS